MSETNSSIRRRLANNEPCSQKLRYDAGVLAGYAKSITLIRHLQSTLSPHTDTGSQRKILEEAIELIAENIETNNNG